MKKKVYIVAIGAWFLFSAYAAVVKAEHRKETLGKVIMWAVTGVALYEMLDMWKHNQPERRSEAIDNRRESKAVA